MTKETRPSNPTETTGFQTPNSTRQEFAEPDGKDRSMRSLLMLMSHEREQNGGWR